MKARVLGVLFLLSVCAVFSYGQQAWRANLDSKVRFYQTTDFGIVLTGTEKSLYAHDGQTGERIWRRGSHPPILPRATDKLSHTQRDRLCG